MSQRLQQLASWSLSPPLLALARGEPPHPAFERLCQPISGGGVPRLLSHLESVEPEGPFGGPSVALWGRDFGDGHHSEAVHCDRTESGVVFWTSATTDSCREEDEFPQPIAYTEQGLYFWLFFQLIEDQDWQQEGRALGHLQEAALAVGFAHLAECLAFQKAVGARPDCNELLLRRSAEV